METTAQVQPNKSTTMRYRKNTVEEDEQEIQELEKARAGEEEEVEKEPDHPEEKTFKKRYGDLRRHTQKNEHELKGRIEALEAQLSDATKKEIKLPKSDEEIEMWAREYPDIAAIVETIALKKSKEQQMEIEQQLSNIHQLQEQTNLEKAEVELLNIHPDFTEIRDQDEFHDWAEDQPKWVQDALYENRNDARSAARAIDLYKADMGITTKKKSNSNKEAARSVNTRSSRSVPDSDGSSGSIKESDVQAMSVEEYDANKDQIMASIRSGKFIYDVSGSQR